MKRSIGAAGLTGSGGSNDVREEAGVNESQLSASRSGALCEFPMMSEMAELADFWSYLIPIRAAKDRGINELHLSKRIGEDVSRRPWDLNDCIKSLKPGYLAGT